MKRIVPILAALLLVGCDSLPGVDQQTGAQAAERSRVERDDFRKTTLLKGQKIIDGAYGDVTFQLRASKDDAPGSPIVIGLLYDTTRMNAEGWAFWQSAVDENGKEFKVEKVGSEVANGGITYERVIVYMDRAYLEQHRTKGVKVRIEGKRANRVITLYPAQVDGFLLSLDAQGWK